MQHLEDSKILNDFQHGLQSSRSYETQHISFIQDIQTDIIIMDFAKGFDKFS